MTILKLKYPIWFKICFYILTVVVPITVLLVQGFKAPSQIFRVTFGVICILILLWVFVRKFLISNIEKRLIAEKTALEHDYSIDVGSSTKIKHLWFTNELWLTIINGIQVMLIGAMLMLIAVSIQNGALKIKGTSLFITIIYLIAYFAKLVYILAARGNQEELTSTVNSNNVEKIQLQQIKK